MIRLNGVTAAAGLWALSACMPVEPVQRIALADGAVTATAPAGYCVDTRASRPSDGFAVMAPCATLDANMAAPQMIGLATVQVGPAGSNAVAGNETTLRDLLETDEGALLLSSLGQAASVTIHNSQALRNRVTVHFSDTGPAPLPGLQNEEWRSFTDISGHLVTIAVRGLVTAPLQDGTGSWLLDRVVQGLRAPGEEQDAPPEA